MWLRHRCWNDFKVFYVIFRTLIATSGLYLRLLRRGYIWFQKWTIRTFLGIKTSVFRQTCQKAMFLIVFSPSTNNWQFWYHVGVPGGVRSMNWGVCLITVYGLMQCHICHGLWSHNTVVKIALWTIKMESHIGYA